MPRLNRQVILTRPVADSRELASKIKTIDPDIAIHIAPMMAIERVGHEIHAPNPDTGVVFTSVNAVRMLALDPVPSGLKAWCVGPVTAASARARGYVTETAGGTAESLITRLLAERPAGPLIYARGVMVSVPITEILADEGLNVTEVITYRQRGLGLERHIRDLLNTRPCLVALFSEHTARTFSREAGDLEDGKHLAFCLSRKVAGGLDLDWRKCIATASESVAGQIIALARDPGHE